MPIPLIVPALFAAGSAAASYMGNRKAANAREDALAAERIRQQGLDRQADAVNTQSLDRYTGAEDKQTERSNSLAEMFKQPSQTPEGPAPVAPAMPQSDNVVVQNRAAQASDEAREFTDQRADALGNFRSFGDMFGEIGRGQMRDAGRADQLGAFKRGSQGVLPLELEAAMQKGGGMRTLGDVLGLGASLTMGPALGGKDIPGLSGLFGGGR